MAPKKETKPKKKVEDKKVEEKEPEVTVAERGEIQVPEVPANFKTKLSAKDQQLLKNSIAIGATDSELKLFLYVCQRTGLDPFIKQIHLVPIWNSAVKAEVRVPIIGIDGLRSVAERSGAYVGSTDATYEGEKEVQITEDVFKDGKKIPQTRSITVPDKATITVKKVVQGIIGEFTASADWNEFVPKKLNANWSGRPRLMLSKCAEAKALRKAFPQVLSGLYVQEEVEALRPETPKIPVEEQNFEKARTVILKETDPVTLEEFKKKLEKSDKYTEDGKKKLYTIIDDQIRKIVAKDEKQG